MAVRTAPFSVAKLGKLFPPIADLVVREGVTEIMIICSSERGVLVFFEMSGKLYRGPVPKANHQAVYNLANHIAGPLRVDPKTTPLIDGRLSDGSRVAIAVPPAAPGGPCVAIRRFSQKRYSADDLISFGSFPQSLFKQLIDVLRHDGNILVAGGTGSGKTTLLNALIAEFPADDRLVVIEDNLELKIDHVNCVRLEARSLASMATTPRDMVRHALRQRPDHLVLGEVRGPEAYDVLQALNTGHGGSMTTIHANTASDAMFRFVSCAREGGEGVPWDVLCSGFSMAFTVVVHQTRRLDKSRGVTEVLKVGPYDRHTSTWKNEVLWSYERDGVDPAEADAARDRIAAVAAASAEADDSVSSGDPAPESAVARAAREELGIPDGVTLPSP